MEVERVQRVPQRVYKVKAACVACYQPRTPCNRFVQAVAKYLEIALPGFAATGLADDMVPALRRSWTRLSNIPAVLLAADNGAFIIAGLKAKDFAWRPIVTRKDAVFAARQPEFTQPAIAGVTAPITQHGHVCVVIPGSYGGYPMVYSSNETQLKSSGACHLREAFRKEDAPNVEYFQAPAE